MNIMKRCKTINFNGEREINREHLATFHGKYIEIQLLKFFGYNPKQMQQPLVVYNSLLVDSSDEKFFHYEWARSYNTFSAINVLILNQLRPLNAFLHWNNELLFEWIFTSSLMSLRYIVTMCVCENWWYFVNSL